MNMARASLPCIRLPLDALLPRAVTRLMCVHVHSRDRSCSVSIIRLHEHHSTLPGMLQRSARRPCLLYTFRSASAGSSTSRDAARRRARTCLTIAVVATVVATDMPHGATAGTCLRSGRTPPSARARPQCTQRCSRCAPATCASTSLSHILAKK
jgi:hypothetical protein